MKEKAKRPLKMTKAAVAVSPASPAGADAKSTVAKASKAAKPAKAVPKPASGKVQSDKVAAVKPVPAKAAPTKVAPVKALPVKAMPVKDAKGEKQKKEKMVRDSFTMPEGEYAQLAVIKERCLKASVSAKKSEVLRAALKCLASLSDIELTKAITDLDFIKTGRPAKG